MQLTQLIGKAHTEYRESLANASIQRNMASRQRKGISTTSIASSDDSEPGLDQCGQNDAGRTQALVRESTAATSQMRGQTDRFSKHRRLSVHCTNSTLKVKTQQPEQKTRTHKRITEREQNQKLNFAVDTADRQGSHRISRLARQREHREEHGLSPTQGHLYNFNGFIR